jgi:hypothetical protein
MNFVDLQPELLRQEGVDPAELHRLLLRHSQLRWWTLPELVRGVNIDLATMTDVDGRQG